MEQQIKEIYDIVTKNGVENFFTKYSAIIVGVIALIGVISQLVISHLTNKRNQKFQETWEQNKIDADIISKSIVDWLKSAQDVASSICSSASETNGAYIRYRHYLSRELKAIDEKDFEVVETLREYRNNEVYNATESLNIFFKNKYKFKLLFGNNKENDNLLKKVDEIENFFTNYAYSQIHDSDLDYIYENANSDEEFTAMMNDFIEECRVYFKKEWIKAKTVKFN